MPPMVCLLLLWIGGTVATRSGGNSRLLESLNSYEVVRVSSVGFSGHSKHTLSATRTSAANISFNVNAFGMDISVDLQRNDMLFHPDYHEIVQEWKDGVLVSQKRTELAEVEACHYHGLSRHNGKESFAAMSNCGNSGFEGVIHVNNELLSIAPAHLHMTSQTLGEHSTRIRSLLGETPESKSLHIVYRAGEAIGHEHPLASCGVTHEEEEAHFAHVHEALGGLLDGKNFEHHKRGLKTVDADWYVELLVVNDHARQIELGSATTTNSATLTNQVNSIYMATVNSGTSKLDKKVSVVMTSQITMSSPDPWAAQQVFTTTSDARTEVDHTVLIDLFHDWRSTPGNTPAHDNGMLYSGLDFKGGTVGYAGVGSMCEPRASGGIIQTYSFDAYLSGAIIAHELGHNFGMGHDGSSGNSCPVSGFIMNSVLNSNPNEDVTPEFSSCSVATFKLFNQFQCLLNQPTTSGSDPVCGNGFVEADETCDCGQASACTDPCCNATSCRLLPSATCSNDQPCCANCQIIPRSQNSICRAAQSSCDVPEMCNGAVSSCPSDVYKGAGTPCTDSVFGGGLCYSGFCASLNRDCSKVGASGYTSCGQGSSQCGALQCSQPGGVCSTFSSLNDAGSIQVSHGTPCGSAKQCSANGCVDSERLNDKYHWSYGPWEPCYSCGSVQKRTVTCEALTTIGSGSTSYQQNLTASDWMCSPTSRTASRSCVNISLECDPPNSNYLTDKARDIAEQYGAIDKAHQLRDLVPRLYGPEEFSVDDEAYWKGIIVMGLIPLLIGVVCLIWCIGHYTSGCGCGDAAPDPAGYSTSQRLVPWLILISLCAVGLIFACIAEYYNSEMQRGVTDPDVGAVALIDSIIQDALDLSANLDVPLQFITLNAARILNDVLVANVTLDGVGDTAIAAADKVLNDTGTIATTLGSYAVITIPGQGPSPSPSLNLTCAVCTSMSAAFASAQSQAANTPLYSIKSEAQSVQSLLFGYNLEILQAEADFEMIRNKSAFLRTYLGEKQITVDKYKNQVLSAEKIRFPFSLIIFAAPFVFTLMSFIGYFGMSSCFSHQGIVAWSMLVLMWPLMGVHLSLAMTFGDSCVYMDSMEVSIASGTSSGDSIEAGALLACLTDTSIIDALNLTQSFTPPTFSLPTSSFATPELDATLSALQSLTTADLGFTSAVQTRYDNNLAQTGLPPTATQADIEAKSNDADPNVAAAAKVCLTIRQANQTVIADLATLKAQGTQTSTDLAAVSAPLATAQDAFSSIDESLRPLIDACEDLKNLGYCGSIGANYRIFKDTWCNVITTAFSFLALSCLILGIFSAAFVYLSIMLTKRFGLKRMGRAGGKYKENAQMVAVERGNRRARQEARASRRRQSEDAAG